MRRPAALPAVLLLAFAGLAGSRGSSAQPAASPADLEAARAQVGRCTPDGDGDGGLQRLEAACPGLTAALTTLGWKDALVDGAAEHVTAEALHDLLTATRPAARSGPDPSQLSAVMAGLRNPAASESLWQRLKGWFQRTFLAQRTAGSWSWLDEWLQRLTPGRLLRELLVYGLTLGVVGAAALVIVREVRASDVRWDALLRRRAARAPVAAASAAPTPFADWRTFAPAERPAALFRAVARRLSAEGRLVTSGSQTQRELQRSARLDAPDERAAWQALARAAEKQIYAAGGVTAEEAERAVADAAHLWSAPETAT